jgi:hypothetical protein
LQNLIACGRNHGDETEPKVQKTYSRFSISLTTALLACVVLPCAVLAAPLEGQVNDRQPAQSEQKVYRQTGMAGSLETSLAHPDRLPAVMPQFHIGADLSEADRQRFQCRPQWFRLPAWLAGKWHCDENTDEIKTADFRKSSKQVELAARRIEDRTVLMGHQQDLTRQIWHFICVPFLALFEYEKKDMFVMIPLEVSMQQFPNSTPWRAVLNEKFLAVELQDKPKDSSAPTSDNAKEIANITQHDVLVSYSYADKTKIGIDVSEKVYDDKGMAMLEKSTSHRYTRQDEFQPSNQLEDVDLTKLFTEFLQGNGMADRIPKTINK